jgi:phosphoribosylpyrophosphate synthetase
MHKPSSFAVGAVTLLAGSASRSLAAAVERHVGRRFTVATIERFPDGEVAVCLDHPVRGEESADRACCRG